MWTDEQLSAAKYTVFVDPETRQPNNVGTIEISGTNGGIFFMTPIPPFGSLSNDNNSIAGMKWVATIPGKQFSISPAPRGIPVPATKVSDQFVIHDYGNLVP